MPLDEVVRLMGRHRIKRVPVLDGNSLIGIVGRADLLRALARALDEEAVQTAGDNDIRERVFARLVVAERNAR
jgi:CBS domain-containing protein